MVYLARVEDKEIVFTHEVIITATIEEGDYEDVEKFIREKAKKWKKTSIVESINFDESIIKVVAHVSKPYFYHKGTVLAPAYPSKTTKGMESEYFIRDSKPIENEINWYFRNEFKFPERIKTKEEMPKIEVKQILFPEKGERFIILY